MPIFTYTARTAQGEIRSATLEAASRDEVMAQLRRQKLTVIKVEEPSKAKLSGSIPMRDIVIFTRQFSTMINSGLPLVQSLDILSKQSENPTLQAVTRQVVFDVESGHTVADALAKHPNAFTELYVNMVAAGEAGGILDTILMRLATFMEKNDALVRKVKGAMLYPGVIMSVAGGAIAVLLIVVIPTFQNMFGSVGLALPFRPGSSSPSPSSSRATGGRSSWRASSGSRPSAATTRRRRGSSSSTDSCSAPRSSATCSASPPSPGSRGRSAPC